MRPLPWPEQNPIHRAHDASSESPSTLRECSTTSANSMLRTPERPRQQFHAARSSSNHNLVFVCTTARQSKPPPPHIRRRRTMTLASTGVRSRKKSSDWRCRGSSPTQQHVFFKLCPLTLAACSKTKSHCRLVLLHPAHRHYCRGPGHALVACSSTWRAADVLSRPGPGAPLFVYSRMSGRPRGVACYCGAYPLTAAQPLTSPCHSRLVKCHSTVCAPSILTGCCDKRKRSKSTTPLSEHVKGPLAGVNHCSVRVAHSPLDPNGRHLQEPTSLQTIHDACVPLFAFPALGAARHVQVARATWSRRANSHAFDVN